MMGLDALTYPHWREECVEEAAWLYLPMIMRHFLREPY